MPKRKLTGKIISDKMDKTVVVEVERVKKHPKYKKRMKIHKRYKARCEDKEVKIGDMVVIEESRPFSKDTAWIVLKKLSSGPASTQEEDLGAENTESQIDEKTD